MPQRDAPQEGLTRVNQPLPPVLPDPQPAEEGDPAPLPAGQAPVPAGADLPARRPAHSPSGSLTGMLTRLAQDDSRDRVAIADMLGIMRSRAFGPLLLIFAFPNILPSPPGLAGILGLPLIFLAAQMMLGRDPWLPAFIAKRSMERSFFATMVSKITPWLARAESLMRPRLLFMVGPVAQRFIGLVCLILAVALALPVPFANLAPAAAISVLGLGILQRDGLWIGLGMIGSIAALAWVGTLGYALYKSTVFVIENAL